MLHDVPILSSKFNSDAKLTSLLAAYLESTWLFSSTRGQVQVQVPSISFLKLQVQVQVQVLKIQYLSMYLSTSTYT